MPSRSALIMIGLGISGVLLRSRYFTNASTPPSYFISSRFSTAWRMSDSTMVTPELRNASSRRRCSIVAKSNSTMVKVFGEGKNVTSVPRLPPLSPIDLQRRDRDAVGELHEVFFAVAPDFELEPGRQRVDHRDADAVQAAGHLVGVLVEFSAGMQLGHDDLGRRNAFAFVDVGRDAAAVVDHGHRAFGVERHRTTWSAKPASASSMALSTTS